MREEYDFSRSISNPYARQLKQQIMLCLERETVAYFKQLAKEIDIPY